MQTFKSIMQSEEAADGSRVSAARSAVEYTLKLTEQTELLERIERLENEVKKQ